MVVSKKQVVRIDAGWPSQEACLEDVLRDNLDSLYRFALRLTRNAAEAQDLAQEAAARAWERQNSGVQNWRAWLFQTLYHAFISSHRHRKRWGEAEIDLEEEKAGTQWLADLMPPVIRTEDVRRAIEALPEELRAVVWLSDAEELRLREIAEILEWPIGTVASRLWRARLELRKSLSVYGPPREKLP
jgi:RNA polymerase sigma-70 factor, ECF subfamily